MKKRRRPGSTETFSISVDPETKEALRALAESEFGGNLSALVTDLAEEARRRKAAGDFLRSHDVPKLDEAGATRLEREIRAEVAAAKRAKAKRRRAA